MREIKAYLCDTCEFIHADAEAAEKCELSHLPATLIKVWYKPGDIFPERIRVGFKLPSGENKQLEYER